MIPPFLLLMMNLWDKFKIKEASILPQMTSTASSSYHAERVFVFKKKLIISDVIRKRVTGKGAPSF